MLVRMFCGAVVLTFLSLSIGPSANGWQHAGSTREHIDEMVARATRDGIEAREKGRLLAGLAWLGEPGLERMLSIAQTLTLYERAFLTEYVDSTALARIRPPHEWFDGGIAMHIAAEALRARRVIDPAWWEALAAASTGDAEPVALVALEVLSSRANRDPAARNHLRTFRSHPSKWRRRAAIHAIATLSGDLREYENDFLAATTDEDPVVRIAATWALRDPIEPNERVEQRLRAVVAGGSDVAIVARHALVRRTLPSEPLLAAVRACPEPIRFHGVHEGASWNTALRLARELPDEYWDAESRKRVEMELRAWANHLWMRVLDEDEWRHASSLAKLGETALIAFEQRPPKGEWLRDRPYHWVGSAFAFAGLVEFGKALPDDTAWAVYTALVARREAELPKQQLVEWPAVIGCAGPVAAFASMRLAHEICAGTLWSTQALSSDGHTLWRSLGEAGRVALDELRGHPDERVQERAEALLATLGGGDAR
jgi:hypothetical protein